jgi:hypothetical protein
LDCHNGPTNELVYIRLHKQFIDVVLLSTWLASCRFDLTTWLQLRSEMARLKMTLVLCEDAGEVLGGVYVHAGF